MAIRTHTPYPQRVEFEYDGHLLNVLVDGQHWGRVESPGTGWWHVFDATGRQRTRNSVLTSDLRDTVARIAHRDRKRERAS